AQKLTSALGKFDASSLTNLGNMVSGSAEGLAEQGTSLLSSLFSGNVLSSIIDAVGRFAGIGGTAGKTLLGYLTPLALGTIAKQFIGKTINPQALTEFFASQKSHITNALPAGFSLAEVAGPAHVSPAGGSGRAEYEAREAGAAARPAHAYDTGRREY